MHHGSCRDQLTLYGDIALGGADNSAFLVFIIILLPCEKVNTSDNIALVSRQAHALIPTRK